MTVQNINIEKENIKRKLRLRDDYFIGQFTSCKQDGYYIISDIRDSNFVRIEDQDQYINNPTISFYNNQYHFKNYAYYKFTWTLCNSSPLEFSIDTEQEIILMNPNDIIRCIYDDMNNLHLRALKTIQKSLASLNRQFRKEVFIYELLQNANDFPHRDSEKSHLVDVEFYITNKFLIVQHTGEYFNPRNISALCSINDGDKYDKQDAIGYKGIGFKSVFRDHNYVYLQSGDYSFRFDKQYTDRSNTPWQILPVWTEPQDVPHEIQKIFKKDVNKCFRVKFALKPYQQNILTNRSLNDNYVDLFKNIFDTERVILFIPNINKVSIIFDNGIKSIIHTKDHKKWCISENFIENIPENIQKDINDDIESPNGSKKIPEKYKNFQKTSVKFACQKDGNKLSAVKDAILYCYLPIEKCDFGFNFLMNTDIIPNEPRDDIENVHLNHILIKIAGKKFFYWIQSLIECKQYEINSVFQLIPDFDRCKIEHGYYEEFINEFQKAFEEMIQKIKFIPVLDKNNNLIYAYISHIIVDQSGLTANNIMSDKDFLSLMDYDMYYLPVPELRSNQYFIKFLCRYSPKTIIDLDKIKDKCTSINFKKWLKNRDNNIKFIIYLLQIQQLDYFSDKPIFIEYKCNLYQSSQLYYNYDLDCHNLEFLKEYIPHLCPIIRKELEKNKEWKLYAENNFMKFNISQMIHKYIINNHEIICLLANTVNSISFYQFIAEYHDQVHLEIYKDKNTHEYKIPYIDKDDKACKDYHDLMFFYDSDIISLSKEQWLSKKKISILSEKYFTGQQSDNSIKNVFKSLGFKEYNVKEFIQDIICKDIEFCKLVNLAIDGNITANISFINFVYQHRHFIHDDRTIILKKYVLSCIDLNNNEIYKNSYSLVYFNNQTYIDNKSHIWLENNMMYSVNQCYFYNIASDNIKDLEQFFKKIFGIQILTSKSFFKDIVYRNKDIIYNKLYTKTNLIYFIDYLKRDARYIFDDSLSFNQIKYIPLLDYNNNIITRNDRVILLEYNQDAIELYNKNWCPKTVFIVVSKKYTDCFNTDILQYFKIYQYHINEILDRIIQYDDFTHSLNNKLNNLDFWRWIHKYQDEIKNFDNLHHISMLDNYSNFCHYTQLYISDIYQKNGTESLVKKYDKNALFISEEYIKNTTDNNEIDMWLSLFKKLKLKLDNKDIFFNSILPNLSMIQDDSIVNWLTEYIDEIILNWNTKKFDIIKLQVRTNSGQYKTIDNIVIIDINEQYEKEPFKYIILDDETSQDIYKNNKSILLLIAKEFNNICMITSYKTWAEEKLKKYINVIQDQNEQWHTIHVEFIRELAQIDYQYHLDRDLIDQIKYLIRDKNKVYDYPNKLTLGKKYEPNCDFEQFQVTKNLNYISEKYLFKNNIDKNQIIILYFKSLSIHHDIEKEDLKFLQDREFAIYFWSSCFIEQNIKYQDWCKEKVFDNIQCIPTEKGIANPTELYSYRLKNYVKQITNWQNNIPYSLIIDKIKHNNCFDIFQQLSFCNVLKINDCIEYLLNSNENRTISQENEIFSFIIQSNNINREIISSYRENKNAKLINENGELKHIKELYAIHPEAKQERDIFSGNKFIIHKKSLLSHQPQNFEKICNILHITYLKSSDFQSKPINKKNETEKVIKFLTTRLRIIAYIQDKEAYHKTFTLYLNKIKQYQFFNCEKIDISLKNYHNNNINRDIEHIYIDRFNIYYVKSYLHHRVYTIFVQKLKEILNINIDNKVCIDIFDQDINETYLHKLYCPQLSNIKDSIDHDNTNDDIKSEMSKYFDNNDHKNHITQCNIKNNINNINKNTNNINSINKKQQIAQVTNLQITHICMSKSNKTTDNHIHNNYTSQIELKIQEIDSQIAQLTNKIAILKRERERLLKTSQFNSESKQINNITEYAEFDETSLDITEEFKQAFDKMENSQDNIFITGGAGTGKSTLLQYFCKHTRKQFVILAPTGVAALNVNGMTIHSFFKFPTKFLDPDKYEDDIHNLDPIRRELIKKLDIIIIDEISMVRADLFDAIDYSLKIHRSNEEPFGGIQMILFGDLFQLPPVLKNDLKGYFYLRYNGIYFFNSNIFHTFEFTYIELRRIFRQKNKLFQNILNNVRIDDVTQNDISRLNSRYDNNYNLNNNTLSLTLCTTNYIVYRINKEYMDAIQSEQYIYPATIIGKFDKELYPTEKELILKKDAQIMMIRNHPNGLWQNGTLGIISDLDDNSIIVNINGNDYPVSQEQWDIYDYQYQKENKQIVQTIIGSFIQYPIKPAWAITIHKSQGQTFDNINIDLGQGTFAHGQLYVALSRCRTLDGIILKTEIKKKILK